MEQAYQSLQDRAYVHLKNLIMNGGLDETAVYSETKMAKELAISRTPFKAALVRLSQDKYIDILPSRGFRVHRLSEQDIETTYQTRTAIEMFCALLVMEKRTEPAGEKAVRGMEQSVGEMDRLLCDGEEELFREQDRLFHAALLACADNGDFSRLYEYSIYHQVIMASRGHPMSIQEREITRTEHQAILDAVRGGSVEDCCRSVRRHMQTNRDNSLVRLKARTDPL